MYLVMAAESPEGTEAVEATEIVVISDNVGDGCSIGNIISREEETSPVKVGLTNPLDTQGRSD